MLKVVNYINQKGEDKKLTLLKQIGKGQFGVVYETLLEGFGNVAVKCQKLTREVLKEFNVEIRLIPVLVNYSILVKKVLLNPKNKDLQDVIQIPEQHVSFSEDVEDDKIYSIYDLISDMALNEIVKLNIATSTNFSKQTMKRYTNDLLQGLLEMHNASVIHRDIKPANIMLVRGTLKYIDFGNTCFFIDCKDLKGTPNYLPPESYKNSFIDWYKLDIFALGVTILNMITNKSIWELCELETFGEISRYCLTSDNDDIREQIREVIEKTFESYPDFLEYKSLIIDMLEPDQDLRCNIKDCIKKFNGLS